MPLRFLIVLCTVTVAAGAIIYEHREQILDYTEGPRQQIADFLHKVADGMSPIGRQRRRRLHEQELALLTGRPLSSSPLSTHDEKKTEPQLDEKRVDDIASATATGKDSEEGGCLRFRGGGATVEGENSAPLPLDSTSVSVGTEKRGDTTENVIASRRSSSATYTSTPALPVDSLNSQMQSFDSFDHPPPPSNSSSATVITEAVPPPLPPTFDDPQPYWSIHEWANNTSRTAAENSDTMAISPPLSMTGSSMTDDLDHLSDMTSEVESVNSWTDVASEISA